MDPAWTFVSGYPGGRRFSDCSTSPLSDAANAHACGRCAWQVDVVCGIIDSKGYSVISGKDRENFTPPTHPNLLASDPVTALKVALYDARGEVALGSKVAHPTLG